MLSEKAMARIRIGSRLILHATKYFQDSGFVQLLPLILGKSTDPLGPDPGSSILKTPEIEYLGNTLYTMNSMILHKQLAVREFDRIFIMSPNIRLEAPIRRETGRHLFEFTQLDFEIAHGRMQDIIGLTEGFLSYLSSALAKDPAASSAFGSLGFGPFDFAPPFKRYTTHELEHRYGRDWETKASLESTQPFWALCHKREFYEKEDPGEKGHYLNYDLIYPQGYGEALSGGEREHDYNVIKGRMGSDRLNMDVYKAYLTEAEKGLVPSAGAGIGIERLTRFLTRADHVGDVQLFRRVPGEEIVM